MLESTNIPQDLMAYGWIPFVLAILLSLLFSALYVRHFWSSRDKDRCSAATSILGLSVALLAALLLPVDVFVVSFMKNTDGSFKEWATNETRDALDKSITYTYYSIYIIILVFIFFILPFAYFVHEEREEVRGNTFQGVGTAFMYTIVFFLIAVALLIAGAFIPYKGLPSQNSTEWDKIEFLLKEMYSNRGEEALDFALNVMTVLGMINLIFYTGIGMAYFPLSLMKGFRPLSEEQQRFSDSQSQVQSQINIIRNKQQKGKSLSSRDRSTLADLEEKENLISRRVQHLNSEKQSLWNKMAPVVRILSALCGVIGILFALMLWVSLLITNIDKLINSLGYKMGYVLKERTLPNPLDIIMVQAQRVFPIDYMLFFTIIIFLVMCTISGVRYLGIRCFCMLMYKVRPHRTQYQGLIMLCAILMYTILALNVLMYSVIPTYTTFGSQHYCAINNSTGLCQPEPCNMNVPSDDCVMTRASLFVIRFAYKAWIFSATYFWLTWGFLAAFCLGFIVTLVRAKQSSIEEAIDSDDFDDSDDEQMTVSPTTSVIQSTKGINIIA